MSTQFFTSERGILPPEFGADGDVPAESCTVATLQIDASGCIEDFDAEAAQFFGCGPDAAVGHCITTLLPTFPRAFVQTSIGVPSRVLSLYAQRADGTRFPVEVIITEVRAAGQCFRVCTLQDLTTRRRAEEAQREELIALREKEERFHAFMDNSPAVAFMKDEDGRYVYLNAPFEQMFQVRSADWIGKTVFECLPEETARALDRDNRAVLASSKPIELLETVPTPDGVQRQWLTFKFVFRSNIGKRFLGCMAVDVTEQKAAERGLRESEQQLRTIFDATAVGIAHVDMAGRLTRSNPAFQKMLGYNDAELTGLAFARLTHPDDAQANVQLQWELQEGKRDHYKVEKRYCCKDGTLVWANLTMSLVRDVAGQPQFAIAVIENMTERKHAQQQIISLNSHLERRLERIAALRRIDMAIIHSPEMCGNLQTVLEEVRAQLGVDAATILLSDASGLTLNYFAGSGLRRSSSNRVSQAIGFGFAGQAVRERRTVTADTVAWMPEVFAYDPEMAEEGFVAYWAVPLIAKGEVKGVMEVFQRSPLSPDSEWLDYLEVLAGQAAIAIDSATMFQELQRSNEELTQAYDATIEGWGRALDLRDQETEGHSQRVTELTLRLAHVVSIPEAQLIHIRRGALLHDIGKMGVPDRILLKTEDLSPTEWRVMRRHPSDAHEMLSPIPFLRPALEIPYCHHERWDGTGYPRGVKGIDIPLAARLFAVVDVWDALRSDRPYRNRWPERQVLDHIRSLSGTHFDPEVVDAFLKMMTQTNVADEDLLPLPAL